ncbi:MAG: hypothetical protein J6N56_00520, partial [Bacteroidales bacterium]|nr:hypothetical protein [Bacteroidales bacterium]
NPSATRRDLYNGKEIQTIAGTDYLDYGFRQYDPVTARWMAVDPKAEKYLSMTPYSYCAGNPINFIDLIGDTLKLISNSKEDLSATLNIYNKGLGGYYRARADKEGYIFLERTKKNGKMTSEETLYYDELKKVIEGTMTEISIVRNDSNVAIGSADLNTIDIGDIEALTNRKYTNPEASLLHETIEQHFIQNKLFYPNEKKGKRHQKAHELASEKEHDYTRTPGVVNIFELNDKGIPYRLNFFNSNATTGTLLESIFILNGNVVPKQK